MLGVCCLGSSCESEQLGDTIPAGQGMVQPEGNGQPIDELTACQRIVAAESAARDSLGCAAPDPAPVCPDDIRPAGTRVCLRYDEGSVAACEQIISDYESCEELEHGRCIVTALSEPADDCGFGGAGGGAGAAGSAGTAGAGAGGPAGAAGAAGA